MESKEEKINLIAGRIIDEYRKHHSLEWHKIAASKIYSQWFEYYDQQSKFFLEEIERLKQSIEAYKLEEKSYKSRITELQSDIKRFKSIQSQETTRANELQDEVERLKSELKAA